MSKRNVLPEFEDYYTEGDVDWPEWLCKVAVVCLIFFATSCATIESKGEVDMTAAPLGNQARENYYETHQHSYLFKWAIPVGRNKHAKV